MLLVNSVADNQCQRHRKDDFKAVISKVWTQAANSSHNPPELVFLCANSWAEPETYWIIICGGEAHLSESRSPVILSTHRLSHTVADSRNLEVTIGLSLSWSREWYPGVGGGNVEIRLRGQEYVLPLQKTRFCVHCPHGKAYNCFVTLAKRIWHLFSDLYGFSHTHNLKTILKKECHARVNIRIFFS